MQSDREDQAQSGKKSEKELFLVSKVLRNFYSTLFMCFFLVSLFDTF